MGEGARDAGIPNGHAFSGVRDRGGDSCPFVLSDVEKPFRGSEAGAQDQLSKRYFWGKQIYYPFPWTPVPQEPRR